MSEYTLKDLGHIGSAELSYEAWTFDQVDAWRAPDGSIYLGTDSGCSCPTPFDWLKTIDQLTGPLTVAQAVEEIKSLGRASWKSDDKDVRRSVARLVATVRGR